MMRPRREVPWVMEMEGMEVSVFQPFVAYTNESEVFVVSECYNMIFTTNIRVNRRWWGIQGSTLECKA
jgi:hypothetical protein